MNELYLSTVATVMPCFRNISSVRAVGLAINYK
jgi:hypothetical protein